MSIVLESIVSGVQAEKRPFLLILFGFGLSSLAMMLAMLVWSDQASMVFIFLTVMGSLPVMYSIIKLEEKKDVSDFHEVALLKEHWKALLSFMALFLGIMLAVVLWYIVLPSSSTSQLFASQISTFNSIRITGEAMRAATGMVANGMNEFSLIFFNNIKVLVFCVVFSFVYGAGAIFILTWNASVIGVAIGSYIRGGLADIANLVGLNKLGEYLSTISFGLLMYALHGIPEIGGYFVAALAGGIVSVAVIRHDFKGRKFEHIVLDAADLLLLSIVLIFLAAILEVWVTPIIFP